MNHFPAIKVTSRGEEDDDRAICRRRIAKGALELLHRVGVEHLAVPDVVLW